MIADVGAHQAGDVARLLVEGRGLVVRREAVAEAHAPEPLGVVEQLLTAAVIEERPDRDGAIDRELRRERQLVARERRSEVHGGVAKRHFACRQRRALRVEHAIGRLAVRAADDAIAVLVLIAQDRDGPVAA